MDVERRVEIAAPPGEVWSVMIDVERWPEWTPTTTSVERLDRSPFAVGSRVRIRQPRLPAAIWTVTTLEPGRYFEWRNAAPGLRSVAGHRVDPAARGAASGVAGATSVTLTFGWSGWLAPLVRVLYGRLARRYVQTEAESLKRRCERRR